MYLYLYLRLINYKLGNKGRKEEGGKNAKIRWNLYFCKTWECKKFFVFSCPSMMIAVFTIGSLCWSSQQYTYNIYVSYITERRVQQSNVLLCSLLSRQKRGLDKRNITRKSTTLIIRWFYLTIPPRTTPVVLFKFKLNRFTTHSCTAYFIQTSFSL